MNVYQLAQAARDASVCLMKNHRKPERDLYVKDILENAKKISLQQATELLNTLQRPREAYPQQVEKAFLLAGPLLDPSLNRGKGTTLSSKSWNGECT